MKKTLLLLLGITAAFLQIMASAAEESHAVSRAQAHTELAAAYFSRGQLGVALEELKIAVKVDAVYAPAYNMFGLVYMELREFPQAEDNFQHALSLDASNPDIHNNYGLFLCQRGRVDDAIKHFFASLKNPLYTTPEKAYLNAGLCSIKINDFQSASDYFSNALKLRPQQPQALYYLSELAYRRNDFLEAKNYLAKLLLAAPVGSEALWLGVRVERKLGNHDAESEYALKLHKNFPNTLEAQALHSGNYEFSEWHKPEQQQKPE